MDDRHHDLVESDIGITISDADQRALDLFKAAVLQGPRDRATILVKLNAALFRHGIAVVNRATGGRKYG